MSDEFDLLDKDDWKDLGDDIADSFGHFVEDAYKDTEDWILDDVTGIRDLDKRIFDGALGLTDQAAANRKRQRQATAIAAAQRARDMPTMLANAALAARRKRLRGMSLMASGSASGASGSAPLSNVMATGLDRLGA